MHTWKSLETWLGLIFKMNIENFILHLMGWVSLMLSAALINVSFDTAWTSGKGTEKWWIAKLLEKQNVLSTFGCCAVLDAVETRIFWSENNWDMDCLFQRLLQEPVKQKLTFTLQDVATYHNKAVTSHITLTE